MSAAEQLFAEKGFQLVSVRDITQLAKTNVAAVNYHFGSRDALVGRVMMRYILPVTEERLIRLEAIELKWSGKTVPLEEIIDAFVRPLASQVRKSELPECLFYKLLGRIFTQQCDGLPHAIDEQLRQVAERFMRAFGKALPSVPAEELAWRLHFMTGGLIHLLTHQEGSLKSSQGASGAPTMEARLNLFIRFATTGLREGVIRHNSEAFDEPAEKGPQATFDF